MIEPLLAEKGRSRPLATFLLALTAFAVVVLYLLPAHVHLMAYGFLDRHIGIPFGLMVISRAMHLLSFALLAVLVLIAFGSRVRPMLVLGVFAVVLEGIQILVPYRSGDMEDLVMNFLGMVIGVCFYKIYDSARSVP